MNELEILRATYPRVSDILGKQTEADMRKIPLDTLARATLRGIKVHGYCLSYAAGLFLADIEEEYQPYVKAFTDWYDENVEQSLHDSTRLYDDKKRFSGEFDFIVKMKSGEVALVDIKATCAPSKTWGLQLAAYNHLCELNGYKVDRIFNLHLHKKYSKNEEESFTVKSKVIDLKDIGKFWDVFQAALACYDYFDRKEVK